MNAVMPPGMRIGHYEIEAELGGGAMGVVYRARDTRLFDRPVAIKILAEKLAGAEIALSRFRLEVEVAAKLAHPNIVTIFDQGIHEGRPYFVMEYLEGLDLARLIRQPDLRRFDEKLRIAIQVCEGLDYAHAQGVVHRDLKPANIMITQRGGRDEAKLVDFGIVHVDDSGLTRDGAQPGTFNYMAPEQLAAGSAAAVSARSDLFSLGIVLCELFSGVHPFRGRTEVLTANRILSGDREPVGTKLPDEAAGMESILLALLQHDPAQRPERAAAISVVLQGLLLPFQAASTDPALRRRGSPDPAVTVPSPVDKEIEAARSDLEIGRLDEARQVLVQALKRDATDPRVQRMLDRILHISERQIPCREYFRALKHSRSALSAGDLEAAGDRCREAAGLWHDDYEWQELQAEIEAESAATSATVRPTPARAPDAATAPVRAPETATAPIRSPTVSDDAYEDETAVDEDDEPRRRRRPAARPVEPRRFGPVILGIAGVLAIALLAVGGWWLLGRTPDSTLADADGPRIADSSSGGDVAPSRGAPPVRDEDSEGPGAVEPEAGGTAAALPGASDASTTPETAAPGTAAPEPATRPSASPKPASTPATPEKSAIETVPATGTLVVTSRPASAEVFVADKYRGTTPLKIDVPPGDYPVRVELKGHESWTRSVHVEPRAEPELTARLVPRAPAQPAESAGAPTDSAPSSGQGGTGTPAPSTSAGVADTNATPPSPDLADSEVADAAVRPPADVPPVTATELWARAKSQRDEESYDALAETLDELLAIDPGHEKAANWRNRIDRWREGRADDWDDIVAELLDDFRAYIADRELDNLTEQWGGRMDAETRTYFERLFGDHEGAVRAEVGEVVVHPDDRGTNFVAEILVKAKPRKGLRVDYEDVGSYAWRGRVEEIDGEYVFTRPFP